VPKLDSLMIGLISDTHGLLRPEVFQAFAGVDHILHAGDVGEPEILDELEAIAPVTAVWGNVDGWEVRGRTLETARLVLAGVGVAVTHGQQFGAPTGKKLAAAFPEEKLVVFGHSHSPEIKRIGSVLTVNPGSAGPARFNLPVTVALARVADGKVSADLVRLLHG